MFQVKGPTLYFNQLGVEPAMFGGVAILRNGKIHGLMLAYRPELLDALAAARK